MVRRLRVVGGVLAALALLASGCDDTITDDDLLKWTNNDVGLAKIAEVVADPEVPVDTRVRALEVVTTRGFPLRVHRLLMGVSSEGDRRQIASKLAAQLVQHIEKGSEHQLEAKDAAMTLEGFLPPEEWDKVQSTVAKWAFDGINWETTNDELRAKIGTRMSRGQIVDTGKYGWDTAAVLISRGYLLDVMVRYLGEARDPRAIELLLKALAKRQETAGAQMFQIEALRETKSSAAVAFLLDMYLDEKLELELRATAFNEAIAMLALEEVKSDPDRVVAKLLALGQRDDAEDRWQSVTNLLHLGTVDKLEAGLAAFKEDDAYSKAEVEAARSLQDFCLDIYDLGLSAKTNPIFAKALLTGNRLVKAISIACLKANRGYAAREQLGELAATAGGKDDVSVADFLGEELTLGRMAQNAIEGLEMLAVLDREKGEGKYTDEQYKTRREYIFFELALVGDPYKAALEERYKQWLEAVEAKKKADAEAAANPPKAEDDDADVKGGDADAKAGGATAVPDAAPEATD